MLKLGEVGGYDLPYFSKEKYLTKDHIISQFTGDQELLQYLPDKVNKSTVSRSFLLALLFNIRKEKYLKLYNIYKEQKANRAFGNGKVYNIEIRNDFANTISKFTNTSK